MSVDRNRNIYVGHRYVPKVEAEPWDNSKEYEGLTVVLHEGNSFTSRQHVPVGVDINNEEFWASTGNYNAQIEHYRQDVRNLEQHVEGEVQRLDGEVTDLDTKINSEVERIDGEVTDLDSKVNNEVERIDEETSRLEEEKADKNNVPNNKQFNDSILHVGGTSARYGANQSKAPNPTITIIDDDVRNELYTKLYPVIRDRNIPISAGLISSRVGVNDNTITYEQFREMHESGLVEFLNHTHDHVALDNLTEEEVDYQIRMCEEWLRREGIFTRHLVYPFGKYNHMVRRVASKYVDSATIVGSQVFAPSKGILDSYYINRTTLETPMDTIKARIDRAKNDVGWLIINTHAQYPEFTEDRLLEVITYAENQGLVFKNFSDAYKDFSNILELRRHDVLSVGVSATGQTVGVKDFRIYHPNTDIGSMINNFTNATPITSYPKDEISEVTLNTENALAFGLPSAGTLTTRRKHNDDYSFQEFQPIRTATTLRRHWDNRTSEWTPWGVIVEVVKKDFTLGPYEIDGNASQNITINHEKIVVGETLINVTPQFALPNGLHAQPSITGEGTAVLRVYNRTTSTITLPSGKWLFGIS